MEIAEERQPICLQRICMSKVVRSVRIARTSNIGFFRQEL
jgi:hypothetical protein